MSQNGTPKKPRKSKTTSTVKHRRDRFVEEYLIDQNAAAAYVRAGYKAKTPQVAAVGGSRLLANAKISEAIARRQIKTSARLEITRERIAKEYARIAFADLRNVMEWRSSEATAKDSASLDDDTAAAISEVAQTKDGLKIKMHDKTRALDALARHLGMLDDKKPDDKPPVQFVISAVLDPRCKPTS